jgi:Leucine-rich repeat (LRR) protein
MKRPLVVLRLLAALVAATAILTQAQQDPNRETTARSEKIALKKLSSNLGAPLKWLLATDPCYDTKATPLGAAVTEPWPGLRCTPKDEVDASDGAAKQQHHHVTSLVASGLNVSGALADDAIGALDHLRTLDLSDNQLVGALAKLGLQKLPDLVDLNLSGNAFTGAIPLDLLTRTDEATGLLNLSHNRLTGELVDSPEGTQQLFATADVRCNLLTGTSRLLKSGGACKKCPGGTVVVADSNQCAVHKLADDAAALLAEAPQFAKMLGWKRDGDVCGGEWKRVSCGDTAVGALPRVKSLSAEYAGAGGDFIAGVFSAQRLDELRVVNVKGNRLGGRLPASLFALPKLTKLDVSHNQIRGVVPPILADAAARYEVLDLSHNLLTGELAPEMPLPAHTRLSCNFLYGSHKLLKAGDICDECPPGTTFVHDNNQCTLDMRTLIGDDVPALQSFEFANAAGWVGTDFSKWHGVTITKANENHRISGVNMHGFKVGATQNGYKVEAATLQPLIVGLTGMSTFIMTDGLLEGALTDEFEQLFQLQTVDVSRNKLSGPLAFNAKHFKRLKKMDLSHNYFTGALPSDWPTWEAIEVRCNVLEGTHPALMLKTSSAHRPCMLCPPTLRPRAATNQCMKDDRTNATDKAALLLFPIAAALGWSTAKDVCTFVGVTCSEDDAKRVIGVKAKGLNVKKAVPVAALAQLSALESLELSHCGLTGHLPASILLLDKLHTLDVSFNRMDGEVSEDMARMSRLKIIRLQNNNFTGELDDFTKEKHNMSVQCNQFVGDGRALLGAACTTCVAPLRAQEYKFNQCWPPSTAPTPQPPTPPILKPVVIPPIPPVNADATFEDDVAALLKMPTAASLGWRADTAANACMGAGKGGWNGVVCGKVGGTQRVTELRISPTMSSDDSGATGGPSTAAYTPLRGPLLATMRYLMPLTGLAQLSLASNALTGTVPAPEFKVLELLKAVDLSHNVLHGELSSAAASLYERLDQLKLNHNLFTGSVPATNALPSSVDLSCNQLVAAEINDPRLQGLCTDCFSPARGAKLAYPTLLNNQCVTDVSTLTLDNDLAALYSAAASFKTRDQLKWTLATAAAVCTGKSTWLGVTCDKEGKRVVGVNIAGENLVGSISRSFGLLPHLHTLVLTDNALVRSLPASLGHLPALQQLDVSRNELTGVVPLSLCDLPKLDKLRLNGNRLEGSVPACLPGDTLLACNFLTGANKLLLKEESCVDCAYGTAAAEGSQCVNPNSGKDDGAHRHLQTHQVIMYALLSVGGAMLLVGCTFLYFARRQRRTTAYNAHVKQMTLIQLSDRASVIAEYNAKAGLTDQLESLDIGDDMSDGSSGDESQYI